VTKRAYVNRGDLYIPTFRQKSRSDHLDDIPPARVQAVEDCAKAGIVEGDGVTLALTAMVVSNRLPTGHRCAHSSTVLPPGLPKIRDLIVTTSVIRTYDRLPATAGWSEYVPRIGGDHATATHPREAQSGAAD
jgi:hypothetical protein